MGSFFKADTSSSSSKRVPKNPDNRTTNKPKRPTSKTTPSKKGGPTPKTFQKRSTEGRRTAPSASSKSLVPSFFAKSRTQYNRFEKKDKDVKGRAIQIKGYRKALKSAGFGTNEGQGKGKNVAAASEDGNDSQGGRGVSSSNSSDCLIVDSSSKSKRKREDNEQLVTDHFLLSEEELIARETRIKQQANPSSKKSKIVKAKATSVEGMKASSEKKLAKRIKTKTDRAAAKLAAKEDKYSKPDPFKKAKAVAEAKKLQYQEGKDQKDRDIKQREKEQLKKKKDATRMKRRGKNGQLVMKDVIGNLLVKIRKDVGDGGDGVAK